MLRMGGKRSPLRKFTISLGLWYADTIWSSMKAIRTNPRVARFTAIPTHKATGWGLLDLAG